MNNDPAVTYQYKRPEGTLYKVSIREWNKTFANRGRWPFVIVEVYVSENYADIHYVHSIIGKLTIFLLLPILYLHGTLVQGIFETHREIKSVIFLKKMGRFSSDRVYKSGDCWDKLMRVIGHE